MPSSYTSLLGLVQPATGEDTNTWGTLLNTSLTQLIEDSVANYAQNDMTSTDWTLTTTGGGQQNQARMAILIGTGTPGTTRYIYAPKSSKTYVVINNTDSSLIISGGPTSPTTGVTVASGLAAVCAWDNNTSDFVLVAGGGGGATGGGSDQIFYNNGQTISVSYAIPANNNSGTFGPVTINNGVTVTVPDNSVWTVV